MDRNKKRSSVMMATLMLMSIFVAMGAPQVMASEVVLTDAVQIVNGCLLYTSPSPRDVEESRMPSSA